MTLSNMRHAVFLRSLTHQLSCLSIRGVHQYTREMPTCIESPLLYASQVFYRTLTRTGNIKSVQCSPQKPVYTELIVTQQCLSGLNSNNIVGDISPTLSYDCPKVSDLQFEISTPSVKLTILPLEEPVTNQVEKDSPGSSTEEKMAKPSMLRVKKRKMKKHQRKKRIAKNWAMYRKMKFARKKKKEKLLQKKLARMRRVGERFDAFEEIKKNLEHAKLRGYHVNIFDNKSKHSSFASILFEEK